MRLLQSGLTSASSSPCANAARLTVWFYDTCPCPSREPHPAARAARLMAGRIFPTESWNPRCFSRIAAGNASAEQARPRSRRGRSHPAATPPDSPIEGRTFAPVDAVAHPVRRRVRKCVRNCATASQNRLAATPNGTRVNTLFRTYVRPPARSARVITRFECNGMQ
jgi:hypothetical protein